MEAAANLVGRLQQLPPFPSHDDWAEVIGRMLDFTASIGRIAPDVAARLREPYERILAAWPRDTEDFVPAHNDPNASNLLFDGERLWLIDWETSAPNDALVDLAVVANQLAPDDALRDVLLSAWRGAPPDDLLRARLTLAQLSAQLFVGGALSLATAHVGGDPILDLDAPTPEEFAARVGAGELVIGSAETMTTFAKVVLSQFALASSGPGFEHALAVSAAG